MSKTRAIFASAYKQLSPSERSFVDSAVAALEIAAHRAGEKISYALNRPIPASVCDRAPDGLLERPLVTAAITERIVQIAAERELTGERVIKELMAISFANIGNYIRFEGDTPVFDLAECSPEQLAAIKSIKIKNSGDGINLGGRTEIDVQFHEKIPAIKLLGEYLGLFEGDNAHIRSERSKEQQMLDANAPVEKVADAYAAQIGSV
jgi:Terminase small subunit